MDAKTKCSGCKHEAGVHGKGICFGVDVKRGTLVRCDCKEFNTVRRAFGGVKLVSSEPRQLDDGSVIF